jgi:hypothetical protein
MPSLSYGDDSIINVNSNAQNIFNTIDRSLFENDSKFGIYTDTYYKHLYSMYPTINTCVFRIMEYALGLTHDLYKKWVDYKSNPKLKYDELISKIYASTSNLCCAVAGSDHGRLHVNDKDAMNSSFRYFIRLFLASSKYSDPSMIFNRDEYIEKAFALNAEMEKEHLAQFEENNIFIQVGCNHNEFPMIKDFLKSFASGNNSTSIGFIVVPQALSIQSPVNGQFDNSIVDIKQTVYIDINRLICLFADIYDPGNLPEYLKDGEQNKEEYIKNGLDRYKNLPDVFAKKIILELFDNFENTYNNWGKFLKKIEKHYKAALHSEKISLLTRKLTHYDITGIDNLVNCLQSSERNMHNPTKINMREYNHLLDAFFYSWMGLGDIDKPIVKIGKALICKLFEKAFTTSVMYQVFNCEDKLVLDYYVRDFYNKYSVNDLLDETTKISDYNIRDFIQSIIKGGLGTPTYPYGPKLNNGEYAFFMYSKSLRNTWFDFASYLYVIFDLTLMVKTCEKKVPNSSKLVLSLNKEINILLNVIFGAFEKLYKMDGLSIRDSYSSEFVERLYSLYEIIQYGSVARYGDFFSYSNNFDNMFMLNENSPQNISKFDTKYIYEAKDSFIDRDSDFITSIISNLKNTLVFNGVIPTIIED